MRRKNRRSSKRYLSRSNVKPYGTAKRPYFERLENRLVLADVLAVSFDFSITQFTPNYAPDPLNGDGEYYFTVRSIKQSREIFNSRDNEIGAEPGIKMSFGPDNSPWQFSTGAYLLNEDVFCDTGENYRDVLIFSVFDKDGSDSVDDDIVDIDPLGPDSFALHLNLRTGELEGPYGDYYNGPPSDEFYRIGNGPPKNYENRVGTSVDYTLWVKGRGNEFAHDSNSLSQVTGAEIYVQGNSQFFETVAGFPAVDSDGDGLFDFQETANTLPCGPVAGTNPNRPDIFITVDEMVGLGPLPLPPVIGASNSPNIVITSRHHGLTTGASVTISGVQGNTAANGTYTITRLSNDTFSLNGSLGNGVYTSGGTWSLPVPNPTGTSLDLVVDAFARAPNINPDGSTGIDLHIVRDEILPRNTWLSDLNNNGIDALGEDRDADGVTDPGEDPDGNGLRSGDPFEQNGIGYYRALLDQKQSDPQYLKSISRYVVFADTMADRRATGPNAAASGTVVGTLGASYGSAGFALALGGLNGGQVDEQAAVFMHFLGQSLGLDNGGGDEIDFKPNYASVMNSLWMLPTSRLVDEATWRLDYSQGTRDPLDEEVLSETNGMGGLAQERVAIGPFSTSDRILTRSNLNGPIDLNRDGDTSDHVQRDVTRFRSTDPASIDILNDHDDWSNLRIGFGSVAEEFFSSFSQPFENWTKDYRDLTIEDILAFEAADPSTFSISDATLHEGNFLSATATFVISLDRPLHSTASVEWQVALGGTASSDDLNIQSGTLTFNPDEIRKTIAVSVFGDTVMERDETFVVNLVNPLNAKVYDNFGLGMIIDNDVQAVMTPMPTQPLDTTWNHDGTDRLRPVAAATGGATAADVDSDGRVLVFGDGATGDVFSAIRYNPNGTLDSTFGGDGSVNLTRLDLIAADSTLNPASVSSIVGLTGAVYKTGPDRGKVLIAGTGTTQDGRGFVIARLNVDGSLDLSFGTNGFRTLNIMSNINGPPYNRPASIAIYESGPNAGKFIVVGGFNIGTAGVSLVASRHNANGSLDTSFDGENEDDDLFDGDLANDGKLHLSLSYAGIDSVGAYGYVDAKRVWIDYSNNSEGKILIAGGAGLPVTRESAGILMRLNDNGSLDDTFQDTFGMPGVVFAPAAPYGNVAGNMKRPATLHDFALQPDGKIVAVGVISPASGPNGYVSRINADGTVDAGFNATGVYSSSRITQSVVVADDGRILVQAGPGINGAQFGIQRFNPNGTPDTSFDSTEPAATRDGFLPFNFPDADIDQGVESVLTPDGNVVIAGLSRINFGQVHFATVKQNAQRNDLAVTVDAPHSVDGGDQVTYTIRVGNTGDAAVFPSLQTVLPAGLTFVSFSPQSTDWVVAVPDIGTSGTVTATRRSLTQADGEQVFQLIASVDAAVFLTTDIANSFTVSSDVLDSDLSNNTATHLLQGPCVEAPDDLVTWFRAEGNSLDEHGDNDGGTLVNTTFDAGKVGDAFNFSTGTSYVSVPSATNLNFTNALTIEGWVKPSTNNSNNGLIYKGDHLGSQGVYSLHFENNNRMKFRLNGGAGQVTGTTSLTDGQWYHVAAVYDQMSMRIYVNGVLDASQAYTAAVATNNAPLIIGSYFSPGYSFRGLVDEVSLYSRALTATELSTIVNARGAGKCLPGEVHADPAVAITSAAPNPTNTVIPVTVTFSEPVTGFLADDVSLTNGNISNFAGNGTTYTFNVTPVNQGEVTVNIAEGVAVDDENNGNSAAVIPVSRTFDSVTPTIGLALITPTDDPTPDVTVTTADGTGVGVADGATVTIDVDLNNDGDFADVGELNFVSGVITDNSVTITLPMLDDRTIKIRARVSDIAGNLGTSPVTTLVIDAIPNQVPMVTNPIADQNATEDLPFEFVMPTNTFTDPDAVVGDVLIYSITSGPVWLTIDSTTRELSGTPDNNDVGTIPIVIRATDRDGGSVSDTFDITVANINDAPMLVNPIADQEASAGSLFTFMISPNTFVDVDVNDTLSYSAELLNGNDLLLPAWLSFNAATRTFSGTPTANDVGMLSIRVMVRDGEAPPVFDSFDITVNDGDVTPPASSVTGATLNVGSGMYDVQVSFADPTGPAGPPIAGVQFVDVYYRVNPQGSGSVTQLLGRINVNPVSASGTRIISAALVVQPGEILQFWSVAIDAVGNLESEATPRTDYSMVIADTVGPVTQVNSAVFDGDGFVDLTYSGADVGGGNVASIDIYVEKDPGTGGSSISRIGTLSGGAISVSGSLRYALPRDGVSHSYRFFSIGTDHLGNREGGSGLLSGDPGAGGDVLLNNITVAAPMSPQVTGFDVNGEMANRSSVKTADLLFNDPSFIDDLLSSLNDGNSSNDRVVLERLDLAGNPIGGGQFVPFTAIRDGQKMVLNFGAMGLQQNGVYAVRIDMDGNLTNGFENSRKFHRLKGDTDGDGKVDVADFERTRGAYLSPGLGPLGDVDGDGDVDNSDISFFTKFLRSTTGDKKLTILRSQLDD